VAVLGVKSRGDRVAWPLPAPWVDRRDTGPDVVALDQGDIANLEPGHVRYGVPWSRHSTEIDAERPGAWLSRRSAAARVAGRMMTHSSSRACSTTSVRAGWM